MFFLGRRRGVLHAIAAAMLVPTGAFAQTTTAPGTPPGGASIGTPGAPAAPPVWSADAFASVPDSYRLDIGDTVQINVRRHEDVAGNVLIPADGQIRLPRLQAPVYARGKTCPELAQALADGWSHVFRLRPGQVAVAVTGQRMRRIYVRGNATSGRELDLKPGWRVSELVAIMGGVPQPDRVKARITNERRPDPISVNLDAALNVPGSPENIPLLEGDTFTVDARPTVRLLIVGEGPKGQHEIDSGFGLRRALGQLGFTTNGASGSLADARLYRKRVSGDPNSPDDVLPVDLVKLINVPETPEIALRDMDMLFIRPSERYIYVFGEVGGSRKQYMPEDRVTRLIDVIGNAGGTTGAAKIGDIAILRQVNGKDTTIKVDFGRFLKDKDPRNNPVIQPKDIVVVPNVKRADIGSFFTGLSMYNVMKSLLRIQ